jgi:hypothetical protein
MNHGNLISFQNRETAKHGHWLEDLAHPAILHLLWGHVVWQTGMSHLEHNFVLLNFSGMSTYFVKFNEFEFDLGVIGPAAHLPVLIYLFIGFLFEVSQRLIYQFGKGAGDHPVIQVKFSSLLGIDVCFASTSLGHLA